jgi:hypothetical protein
MIFMAVLTREAMRATQLSAVMLRDEYRSVNHPAVPEGTDFENWLLGIVVLLGRA